MFRGLKMVLPQAVKYCMKTLEQAGFEAYAVGGCVRDSLLGICPNDYDLCTNALPSETAGLFEEFTLVRSGEKHGTIGVVVDGQVVEITTYRTEGGYQDSRHPGWVRFVSKLKEDLARRDFTVNAMAYNPRKGVVDPFGGRKDLKNKILRTVGEPRARFSEDALRILRGVRFSVRFGLTPEDATLQAMKELALSIKKLAKERVFLELCKLIPLVSAKDLLDYAPVIVQAVPVLAPCVGFLQHSPYHKYNVYGHTAYAVGYASEDLIVRWAALLHDCGKPQCFTRGEDGVGHFYGHAKVGAKLAKEALTELKAPKVLRERVVFLIEHHMDLLEADKGLLRRRLSQYGQQTVENMLALQEADVSGLGNGKVTYPEIRALLKEILEENSCLSIRDLQVDGKDLLALGFAPGKELGACLNHLLERVLTEELPNEKEALLAAAKEYL